MTDLFTEIGLADWLNLTSFSESDFEHFDVYFNEVAALFEPEQRNQSIRGYKGRILLPLDGGSVFLGAAVQNGKPHFLLSIAGYLADAALLYDFGSAKCSRIDLQLTFPKPENYSARLLKDELKESVAEAGNQEVRKVSLVENDGDDTIYIGSRKSERFTRLYVKELDDGKYLRYEIELKGRIARSAYNKVLADPTSKAAILRFEWEKHKGITNHAWNELGRNLAESEAMEVNPGRPVSTNETRLRWYLNQVFPALDRDLNDHDIGPLLADYLKNLLKMQQDRLDKGLINDKDPPE